jgi:hypothetical protein
MKILKSLLLACALIQPVVASADAPEPKAATTVGTVDQVNILGQWDGDFYHMTSGTDFSGKSYKVGSYNNTNGHCLKADGTWYMTNNNASGKWFRVGDTVYLHGGGNGFSGAAELTVIKPRLITGHWQSWTADDSFHAFYTAQWRLISKTCLPPFAG